jgi:hypothetical protein
MVKRVSSDGSYDSNKNFGYLSKNCIRSAVRLGEILGLDQLTVMPEIYLCSNTANKHQ